MRPRSASRPARSASSAGRLRDGTQVTQRGRPAGQPHADSVRTSPPNSSSPTGPSAAKAAVISSDHAGSSATASARPGSARAASGILPRRGAPVGHILRGSSTVVCARRWATAARTVSVSGAVPGDGSLPVQALQRPQSAPEVSSSWWRSCCIRQVSARS